MAAGCRAAMSEPTPRITRDRLLEAAGRVFAEKGYLAATGREICDLAGTNLAAINYHFGGKDRLYAEVMQEAHHRLVSLESLRASVSRESSAEEKLRAFIRTVLEGLLASRPSRWHARLIAREMVSPTAPLEALVEGEIRPKFAVFRGIVAELLGLDPDHPSVSLGAVSVIAQCLCFYQNRPVLRILLPGITTGDQEIERIVEHVTRFSLVGLREVGAAAGAARDPGVEDT